MRTYLGVFVSLAVIFYVGKAMACEKSSTTTAESSHSINTATTLYSDHTLLRFRKLFNVSLNLYNIAQPNILKFFPNRDEKDGFNWSTLLRTPEMLEKLAIHKEYLHVFARELRDIANSDLSVAEKNSEITKKSEAFKDKLGERGFPVNSMFMEAHKLFNPGVEPAELRNSPEKYIHGPSFSIESAERFKERFQGAFAELMADSPDFAAAQEISFGFGDNIDYTKINNEVVGKYQDYSCIKASSGIENGKFEAVSVTYYNNKVWDDVSKDEKEAPKVAAIAEHLKCFTTTKGKIIVAALRHKTNKQIQYVANVHADWGTANNKTMASWLSLQKLLLAEPNLIVAGDFNLNVGNANFINDTFADTGILYETLSTPETVNPTLDAVFASPSMK